MRGPRVKDGTDDRGEGMDSYGEALRHLLEADRLMEAADETLFRAELALPIDILMRRVEAQSSELIKRAN